MSKDKIAIFGAGVSGITFAHFLGEPVTIFEKESRIGGLCRSFQSQAGIYWDIGPHITFSKDQETLDFMTSLVPMAQIRRSNQIFYQGRYVKYPFENDLASLPERDRDYCLDTFLNNPYENYPADNMLAFFYKTFGEGITRSFLEPYNRKIWKYETSFMDTQMVERIPKPPPEDVINSAKGIQTEGYKHQLYFHYPKQGAYQSLVDALLARTPNIDPLLLDHPITRVEKTPAGFVVSAGDGEHEFDRIVSTMPIHELIPLLHPAPPQAVVDALSKLYYNSIHITIVHAEGDHIGDHFALTIADPDVPFHRLSRLNFLGESYHNPGSTTLMVEITFRPGLKEDISAAEVNPLVVEHLDKLKLVPADKVTSVETNTFKYAYVIYDIDHRKNTDTVLDYLRSIGIEPLGRFGTFEYINSDQAILRARNAAKDYKAKLLADTPKSAVV